MELRCSVQPGGREGSITSTKSVGIVFGIFHVFPVDFGGSERSTRHITFSSECPPIWLKKTALDGTVMEVNDVRPRRADGTVRLTGNVRTE